MTWLLRWMKGLCTEGCKQVLLRLYTVLMIVLSTLAIMIGVCAGMGIRPRILVTSSMEPEIRKNSLVLVDTSARFEDLEEGQVITFHANNTEVLHRVTGKNEDGLIVTPDKEIGEAVVNKNLCVRSHY